ncbi:glutathione S-transferase C-terminal domain-containing protein [Streptomyces sp. NBC_01465]|uniref:glutathione S-transferase C-terminal domain-containing protein n=1 Tax=Streptomyces sp. NBC_01465 TaxID=2903878 RepID=UPI002E35E73E|nr:glutathione S-transferase C-terminal domain-containing protein [Streptomyces sp. NBC_01465]
MPKTASRSSSTATSITASPHPHRLHSRIGVGAAGGFYPAPGRYDLFLSQSCPRSLRISLTLDLLGLRDTVATTVLASPGESPAAYASLRRAYEATVHHFDGPLTVPALRDRWSGRIVSNHTPDILSSLAGPLSGDGEGRSCTLRPPHLAADIDALCEVLDRDVAPTARPSARRSALNLLDRRLSRHPFALGESLTAADVDLWVALVHLDRSETLCAFPRLSAYVQRLGGLPAFRGAVGAVPDAA